MIDIPSVAAASLHHAEAIAAHYLPGGRQVGREYVCSDLSGGKGDSTSVNMTTGKWADFATGDKGGDLVSLVAASLNCSQLDAARELAEFIGHGSTSVTPSKAAKREIWTPIIPVPDNAPPPPKEHYKHGAPVTVETYRDLSGQVLCYEHRYEFPSSVPGKKNDKIFSPLTFCRSESGKTAWRFQAIPDNRPLLGLECLDDSINTMLVVEGGKAAAATRRLAGDRLAGDGVAILTWSGGSNAVHKTDWSPARGLHVVAWPDADKPGCRAVLDAADDAMEAGALSFKIVMPPPNVIEGFDLADAEADGWTAEQVVQYLNKSVTVEEFKRAIEGNDEPGPRPSLFESAEDFFAESVKINFLVRGLIEREAFLSITGPSGQYKSFAGADLVCHTTTGRTWNGHAIERPGAVLCLVGEGRAGWKRRVRAWAKKNGVSPSELKRLYLSRHTLEMDGSNIDQIVEEAKSLGVVLVLIDTLARHMVGHENDTHDMGRFVAAVDDLKARLTCAACVVHHTGHDQTRGRGNSAYKAALDMEIMCDKGRLTFTKMKDAEPPEPWEFKLMPVEIGVDDDGPVMSAVIEWGERSFKNRETNLTANERTILELVQGHPDILSGDLRSLYFDNRRERDPDAKYDTLKKAFSRSLDALIEKQKIHMDGHTVKEGQGTKQGHSGDMSPHNIGTDRDTTLKGCPDVPLCPGPDGVLVMDESDFLFDQEEIPL